MTGRLPTTSTMVKDTMPSSCRGALSSSRTHTEEGYESHFGTLRSQSTQEEEKDLVLKAFASNQKDKSVQSEDLHKGLVGNWGIIRKHSTNSPCFQALTPCSPSESDSSSTFSTLGSSSSSSLFSETGSELSPASTVGSTQVKSVKISPAARRSLQRTNLGSKLDAAVCAENWEDSKKLLKCTLPKPALNHLLTEDALDDGFVEFDFLEGKMIETQACKKNRESNSAYSGPNYPHYDKGPRQATKTEEYPSCSDNADHSHCAIEPLAAANTEAFSSFSSPNRSHSADKVTREASNRKISDKEWTDGLPTPAFFSASAGSPEVCSDTYHSSGGTTPASTEPELKHTPSYNRELGSKHKRDYSNVHFNKDKCQMQKAGLMEQCHAGSKHGRGCSNACGKKGKCYMQGHHGSFELCSHVKSDTQALPLCVTECGSSPYEADIGVNTVSLKSHAFSTSPLEKTSLPRALSLCQPLHTHGKVLSFEPPLKPKPKLSTTFSSSNLLNQEMPYKRGLVDRCALADLVFMQRKGSPRRDLSDRRPLTTPVFDRSLSIIHPHDDIQRFAKASLVRPVSKIHLHDDIPKLRELSPLLSSDIKYVEKADDFTSHSPFSLVEAKHSEGHGVIFSSEGQWDWRSKSIGARASLKSAARNLEAAFVGSRSVSLPKTRSPTPKKDPKPESARLLDRVFVSPMRSRSKQADILKSIERPPHPKGQCNNKDSGVSLKRDANPSPSDIHSHHAMACVPIRPVIRPLPPTGHKHRKSRLEVSCKPFLPVSRSVHCLPAPKGALGLDNPISSRQKMLGMSSNESGAASPFMLQAYLRCAVKDGHPCYTMTIEGSEEMLLARACTLENHPSTEGCKWLYSFHSGNSKARGTGTGGWRSWIRKDNKTDSDLTGIMQVSSVLRSEVVPDTGEVRHLMVSELVLYDGRAAESAHGQSLRFYSSDLPCQKRPMSRESPSSSSNVSSEHILSSIPSHFEMAENQHSISLTNARASSESISTPQQASSPHKGSGGHRPSFSLDIWSESDLPDSKAQELSPCPPLHMQLAAMVIQVPAKDPQRESNVADGGHTEQSSRGWGLNFLDGGSESELSSGVSDTLSLSAVHVENIVKYGTTALGQALAGTDWPHAELRFHPSISSSNHNECSKGVVCIESQKASHLSTMKVSHAQKAENFQHGMLRSSDWITLILPMGDHGLPNGGARGPSSLIERWRSGGSCECGGWDLGCGLKVLSTGSPNKYATSDKNTIKQPLSHDQPLSIFSQQGSRQELMLSLSLVKQGFFKLSFQGQLSPLIAFATAVAILQHQQSASWPSSSTEAWMKADHLKERPPPPPQSHTVTQRRSDFSSKDKAVSAFLELYKNFPSNSVTNPLSPFARI